MNRRDLSTFEDWNKIVGKKETKKQFEFLIEDITEDLYHK